MTESAFPVITTEIPLTRGLSAIVDFEDLDRVLEHTWFATNKRENWYAASTKGFNYTTYLHRFVLRLKQFESLVDHIDGNGLNNSKTNLRLASYSQNNANKKKQNGSYYSEFKGVTWDSSRKKWLSKITVDRRTVFLGRFINEVEAAKTYDKAAKDYYGEFARTNF